MPRELSKDEPLDSWFYLLQCSAILNHSLFGCWTAKADGNTHSNVMNVILGMIKSMAVMPLQITDALPAHMHASRKGRKGLRQAHSASA